MDQQTAAFGDGKKTFSDQRTAAFGDVQLACSISAYNWS